MPAFSLIVLIHAGSKYNRCNFFSIHSPWFQYIQYYIINYLSFFVLNWDFIRAVIKLVQMNALSVLLCFRLERFVASLRRKIPNGLVLEEKTAINNGDVNGGLSSCNTTSESLMSSLGSGSLHSPHVTMSGPVTDL